MVRPLREELFFAASLIPYWAGVFKLWGNMMCTPWSHFVQACLFIVFVNQFSFLKRYFLFFSSLKLSGLTNFQKYLFITLKRSANVLFRNNSGLFLRFMIHDLTISCKNGNFLNFLNLHFYWKVLLLKNFTN